LEQPERLEPPGLREKRRSQGKTERPALPERLALLVRLEQLAQMDEETDRV
jgi:hypothetical protein